MKRPPLEIKLAIVGVLLMIVVPITTHVVQTRVSHQQTGQQSWWLLISPHQPAFVSSASYPAPHAASIPQYPGQAVSLGSTGGSVELIQAALNRYGANLVVNGIFGSETQAAVINFQRTHQLEANGIVDPTTWDALFNSSGSDPTGVYINPIQPGLWAPARTDQGVDWLPLQPDTPVLAIGAGVVTFSSLHSYWVGGGNITYELTEGPKAGLYIYVTEHLTNVLPVGSIITQGEVIATAQPGYPWTEWGWAAPPGTGSYAPAVPYSGIPDGKPTKGGLAMARFFNELGATTLQDPGEGTDV